MFEIACVKSQRISEILERLKKLPENGTLVTCRRNHTNHRINGNLGNHKGMVTLVTEVVMHIRKSSCNIQLVFFPI
jgi:hypothetical protein